jgi:hypothetical protein
MERSAEMTRHAVATARAETLTAEAERLLYAAWQAWCDIGDERSACGCEAALRLIPGRRP